MGAPNAQSDHCAVSIFDATLIGKEGIPVFFTDNPSDALFHKRAIRDDFRNVLELCAGLGIGAMGFAAAGMTVVGACDWSAPFTQAFSEVHPGVPVVTGDIGDKETLKQLHSLHGRPTVMMSGFSCQPFSRGGRQLGALDARSDTLGKTLRAAVMLRSLAVVLECVQDAGSNSMVRKELDQFRSQCGFHLAEIILRLEDVWCSRRTAGGHFLQPHS
jgi:site-specific DNA-cytosine methylase